MIAKCPHNCTHAYQDKLYGSGKRVLNPLAKDAGHRCTVCGNTTVKAGSGKKQS